jgi:hypothetical protein
MSGFEIAGVVLAVLPLILDGLNAFPDSTIAKFVRANQERQEFAQQLLSVQTGFRCVMERLFIRCEAELTNGQWRALRALDAKGSDFLDMWREILASNPDIVKTNTFADTKFMLDGVADVLKEIVKDTAIPRAAGSDLLMGIIENHKNDKTFSFAKGGLLKRYLFVRKDRKRTKLLQRMEKLIKSLHDLINEHELMKKVKISRSNIDARGSKNVPYLDDVRGHGYDLYHALLKIWLCDCHKSPSALLRLETREEPKGVGALHFSLFLTFEHSLNWACQDTQVSVYMK